MTPEQHCFICGRFAAVFVLCRAAQSNDHPGDHRIALHSRRQKETAGAGTPRGLNMELIHQRAAPNLDAFI